MSNNLMKIDPNNPAYTYTDWNNFNGSDWEANLVDCHGFGNITVISHKENPTLKLFVADQVAEILEYERTQNLTKLLSVTNFKVSNSDHLNKINGLQKTLSSTVPPRGLTLINYAGFHHAMMKSTKPNAEIIQQWVYGSVMPSIAETGSYGKSYNIEELQAAIASALAPLTAKLEHLESSVKATTHIANYPPKEHQTGFDSKTILKDLNEWVGVELFKLNYLHGFFRARGWMSEPGTKLTREGALSGYLDIGLVTKINTNAQVSQSSKVIIIKHKKPQLVLELITYMQKELKISNTRLDQAKIKVMEFIEKNQQLVKS